MSEKPSEYLKRTCLICGCHTNQTINIYEPRSGPNIVQLIQAKFKFQPLNEDKYLCFSCNNWLINWHSLQALNSNDAESPSGTFRSHMNSMVPEKGAGSQQHAANRPIAQVRPLQLEISKTTASKTTQDTGGTAMQKAVNRSSAKNPKGLFYMKRNFRTTNRYQNHHHRLKSMQSCCVCGRTIVVRMVRMTSFKGLTAAKKSLNAKCRKCREVSKWRAIYLRSMNKAERASKAKSNQSLVNLNAKATKNLEIVVESGEQNQSKNSPEYFQKPRIDGKVVAMLRRLGTTLSRENTAELTGQQQQSAFNSSSSSKLPPIMSPAKQKPKWTRQLDDDEILLDFNTAISEVLPRIAILEEAAQSACGRKQAKRKLMYHMTNDTDNRVIDLSEASGESETEENITMSWEVETEGNDCEDSQLNASTTTNHECQQLASIYNFLPKELTVSLI